MESLPQELLLAIIHEIDDIPSLKACALTGSMFRDASQRVLLRSLTLKGDMQAAHTLLVESPHVATYITRLSIRFPLSQGLGMAKIEALQPTIQKIMVKLVNVHQCILNFWEDLDQTPALVSTLFDFLERQPLRELHVRDASGVSPASLLRLLTTAPVVFFFDVHVDRDPDLVVSLDNFHIRREWKICP
ncbi:hypothetical protein B0H12DRAFT_131279 [Mycena haematopus]|nr:hypothetical protein B0H12DRAFT_131279 [Mycena haematopus]